MIARTYRPQPPLDRFIDHFDYFRGHQPEHRIERFLPNGDVELIFDMHERPKFIYDNDNLKPTQTVHRLWLSGIRTQCISIPSARESELFIIFFRRGMARDFLGLPMSEIADQVTNGDLILPPEVAGLREHLLDCTTPDELFATAEAVLTTYCLDREIGSPVVQFAVKILAARPQVATIGWLNHQVGHSPRHLIQLFREHVGLTPKTFLRLMRFQTAIRQIEQCGPLDWVSLANDCGYYDQSHFNGDFKRFSGFTPTQYLALKGDALNYVPVA